MHYCLSAQVGDEYIKKVDEIRIKYKELNKLLDLYEINPNLSIILTISAQQKDEGIDWNEIEKYNTMWQKRLIIETDSFEIMDVCKVLDIKFFYALPVNNFYDLKALAEYGCCDVKIDAPLTHMLDKLSVYDITYRMTPNVAYYAFIPRENGIVGSWVRPEDVELYEDYIDVFEFEDCDKKKEEALYRVYNETKSWVGELNKLITNFNYQGINHKISKDLILCRMFCGQKCTQGVNCNICQRFLDISNNLKNNHYKEQ